jgi:hypothetical protein
MSAEQAVAYAWASDGGYGMGTEAEPIYATLPAGGTIPSDVPVWLIRLNGACVPLSGLVRQTIPPGGLCSKANSHWYVIIDATNGAQSQPSPSPTL